MGQLYTYFIRRVKTTVVIFHIYGNIVIFLLFCDHQDTKSEPRGMEIGLAGKIFTKKKSKGLWDNNIHN